MVFLPYISAAHPVTIEPTNQPKKNIDVVKYIIHCREQERSNCVTIEKVSGSVYRHAPRGIEQRVWLSAGNVAFDVHITFPGTHSQVGFIAAKNMISVGNTIGIIAKQNMANVTTWNFPNSPI